MKQILSILVVCCTFPMLAAAEGNNHGAAAYLSQGVGSRASGMGGAFVALADDATAGYWNPAGLAQMELYMYQVGTQYIFLPNNFASSYLSYSFQLPEIGSFSLSWINYGINSLDKRDDVGSEAGDFSSSENAIIISYGRKVYGLLKGLSLGANMKLLQHGLGNYSAVGHGFDLAALWQPVLQWEHTIGINVQNLLQRIYWDSSSDPSLVNAKVGVALKFLPSQDELYFNRLIGTVDIEISEYYRMNYRLGAEYWVRKSLAARAGFNGQEITMGASYKPNYYELDYSFHYDLSEIAAHQHRVSVLLRFK